MRAALLLGLLGLAVGMVLPAAGEGPAAGRPLLAAHRGGALLWPENSLLAFRNAVALGADFLEFDVHLTRDGELVVIHDPTLDRTSTGAGPVRERTLAELRGVRLRDKDGAVTAEPLPTADEVVRLGVAARRQMLLEIKVDDRRRRYPGIEEKVLALLDRHGAAPATVVMGFDPATWRRVRALRPDQRVAALYSSGSLRGLGATLAAQLDEARRAGVRLLGLHQDLVSEETLAAVRGAGLDLGVWTVNDAAAIRRFVGMGVDVVISDRPDLVRDALGR